MLLIGKAVLIICDDDIGSWFNFCRVGAAQIPLKCDGEFGHILRGGRIRVAPFAMMARKREA